MLTPQDVHSVQFDKNLRGYRTEDVDKFLDRVEEQLKQDAEEAAALRRQVEEQTQEIQRLKRELESYRADGDMLKSALINAQRMGESVIREANQKSDDILHRANLRADDIIRDANDLLQQANNRAEEMINEAVDQKKAEEREYERIRLEVTRFKSDVLNLYRSHVESLSRLPEYQREAQTEEASAAVAPEIPAQPETEEQPAETAEPAVETAAPEEPQQEEEDSEDFWEKDENELKMAALVPGEAAPADYSAFQGIQFSE